MKAIATVVVLLCVGTYLSACEEEGGRANLSTSTRGARPIAPGSIDRSGPGSIPAPPSAENRPSIVRGDPPGPIRVTEMAPGDTAMEEDPAATTPERDLSAELRGLAGSPASCFTGDLSTLPDTVRIDVTASVSAYGVVTRATVGGAGVPADARECIRRRVEAGRFRGPVPDAPRSVRTTLTLERQARPPTME